MHQIKGGIGRGQARLNAVLRNWLLATLVALSAVCLLSGSGLTYSQVVSRIVEKSNPSIAPTQAMAVAMQVEWSAGRPIRLRYSEIKPLAGVAPELRTAAEKAKAEKRSTIHVIAQRRDMPRPEVWAEWKARGISYGAYLGEGAWILGVDLTGPETAAQKLDNVSRDFRAQALALLRAEQKANPQLLAGNVSKRAFDPVTKQVELIVTAYDDTPRLTIEGLLRANSGTALREIAHSAWSAKVLPSAVRALVESDDIQFVEEGPFIGEPLMDLVRLNTGAEAVQKIILSTLPTYGGWTGKNVRVSNGEGLDANHDDFWNHNSAGIRTTPRWLGCSSGNGAHGTMTAGIMMGNGWNSLSNGGTKKYQYRGMAPRAIYDCDTNNPDVANWSFTQGFGSYNSASAATDASVRSGFVSVGAVANQGIHPQYGIAAGYYSPYRVNKNEIIVANFNQADLSWARSSLGPTEDGRLKPDIAALGTGSMFPRNQTSSIPLEIDWIQLTGASPQTWDFNTGLNWQGGWGVAGWWGSQNIGTIVQFTDGPVVALRAPILLPPYGTAWESRPLIGTLTFPDGSTTLSINGASGDQIKIRYRLPAIPEWADAGADLRWSNNYSSYAFSNKGFRFIADGQWRTATINVGADPHWIGLNGINEVLMTLDGPAMWIPSYGTTGYGNAGGSSAASPVVAGAVALLHEQIVTRFGAVLGNHSAASPFFFGTPNNGMPLPSTFKAILIQTARDLAYIPIALEPNNPDTGGPTIYHKGPDLASGYGMLDVAEATRLIDSQLVSQRIVEREFTTSTPHTYTIVVPAGTRTPLKVTLAWDDVPGSPLVSAIVPKLVNNLDLTLTSPTGVTHYPWSFDPPYIPSGPAQEPGAIEPEPLTPSSIHPARQDQPNTLDNIEQVYVEFPQAGTWQVTVTPTGLAAPPQKYSLILGTPPKPATMLNGGKVVFCSTRTQPQQLFVQNVGATTAPTQITSGSFPAQQPAWSPDGQYIAYITTDFIVSGSQSDVLMVIAANGTVKGMYHGPTRFGFQHLGSPEWSPDGKKIIVMAYDNWGDRGLSVLQFATPYNNWGITTVSVLMPPGTTPGDLDATDAVFSSDGSTVYFHADNNVFTGALFQIPAIGGTPIRMYGDAEPTRRGYNVSLAPDGKRIIFNSEMWKEGNPIYLDEEILELDLMTGVLSQLTREPGNQYGWFAINGQDGEFVVQSNTSTSGTNDIFLQQNGVRVPLYIADPTNAYNDDHPKWWKSPPCHFCPVPLPKVALRRR